MQRERKGGNAMVIPINAIRELRMLPTGGRREITFDAATGIISVSPGVSMIELAQVLCFADVGPEPHWTELDGPPPILPSYEVRTSQGMRGEALIDHTIRTIWIAGRLPPAQRREVVERAVEQARDEMRQAAARLLARQAKPRALGKIFLRLDTFPMPVRFGGEGGAAHA